MIKRRGLRLDIADLASDPAWLPHRLDLVAGTIAFLRVPRALHRGATFLDDQYLGTPEVAIVPIAALNAVPRATAPIHFIYHSAFCGSTLIARALDQDGVATVLKEPAILNQLAGLLRARRDPATLIPLILALLGRPFEAGEAVVIKPSNVANPLIERLLAASPGSRAILLYAPLPEFLTSVAKKGLWGRIWMRRFHAQVARSIGFDPGFSDADLFEQSDLQVAALGWLHQQAQFATLLRRDGRRFAALTSDALFSDPGRVLTRAAAVLDLRLSAEVARAIADGEVFREHSKELGKAYHQGAREAERAAAASTHQSEIDAVTTWAAVVAARFAVPMELPQSGGAA